MPKDIKHEYAKLSEETAGLKDLLKILENEAKLQEMLTVTGETSRNDQTDKAVISNYI